MLTDQEIEELESKPEFHSGEYSMYVFNYLDFARAVEAAAASPLIARIEELTQELAKHSQRWKWLHSNNTDADGFDWAVMRVKWENATCTAWHTDADLSDLDAEMLRQSKLDPTPIVPKPKAVPLLDGEFASAFIRRKAEAYANTFGCVDPDTDTLDFGVGPTCAARSEYYNNLLELADELEMSYKGRTGNLNLECHTNEFLYRTNQECRAWVESFYIEDFWEKAYLLSLRAWQEQERRHLALTSEGKANG